MEEGDYDEKVPTFCLVTTDLMACRESRLSRCVSAVSNENAGFIPIAKQWKERQTNGPLLYTQISPQRKLLVGHSLGVATPVCLLHPISLSFCVRSLDCEHRGAVSGRGHPPAMTQS